MITGRRPSCNRIPYGRGKRSGQMFDGGKYPRFLSVGGGKSTVSYYGADQSVMQIWTGSAEVAAAWNVNGQLVSYGVCGLRHGALYSGVSGQQLMNGGHVLRWRWRQTGREFPGSGDRQMVRL